MIMYRIVVIEASLEGQLPWVYNVLSLMKYEFSDGNLLPTANLLPSTIQNSPRSGSFD